MPPIPGVFADEKLNRNTPYSHSFYKIYLEVKFQILHRQIGDKLYLECFHLSLEHVYY